MIPTRLARAVAALALCALLIGGATAAVATAAAAGSTHGASQTNDDGPPETLEASFDYSTMPNCDLNVPGDLNPLTLTADRDSYTLTVSATGLSVEHLLNVFEAERGGEGPISNLTAIDGDRIRMRVDGRETTIPTNFSNIETDDYTFTLETDGAASATEAVTVASPSCIRADISDRPLETARNGLVEVPISLSATDQAQVSLRNDDVTLSFEIEDENSDSLVRLVLNTHLLGRTAPDGDREYWTKRGVSVRGEDDTVRNVQLSASGERRESLAAGEYALRITKHGNRIAPERTITITDPSIGVTGWTGSGDVLADPTAASLRSAIADGTLTANGTVENSSALVFEIDSEGVFGPLRAASARYTGTGATTRGFRDLAIGAARTPSAEDVSVSLSVTARDLISDRVSVDLERTAANDALVVVPDRENGTLYVGLRRGGVALNGSVSQAPHGLVYAASVGVGDQTAEDRILLANETVTEQDSNQSASEDTATPGADGSTTDATTASQVGDESAADDPGAGTTTASPTAATADDDTPPSTTTAGTGPGLTVLGTVLALLASAALALRRAD